MALSNTNCCAGSGNWFSAREKTGVWHSQRHIASQIACSTGHWNTVQNEPFCAKQSTFGIQIP